LLGFVEMSLRMADQLLNPRRATDETDTTRSRIRFEKIAVREIANDGGFVHVAA
jgi:hypothetical protein